MSKDMELNIIDGPAKGRRISIPPGRKNRPGQKRRRGSDASGQAALAPALPHRTRSPGYGIVKDLGSKNGTFVDDVRIEGTQPLVDGSLVRIGVSVFKIFPPRSSTEVELEEKDGKDESERRHRRRTQSSRSAKI